LFERLRATGFTGAPRFLGIDEEGREILDFFEGEVGNYPLSEQVRSESALVSAAKLLRSYHDATAASIPAHSGGWQLSPIDPVEVICHGDYAPYNCVFVDGVAIAIIDFDFARPGPRSWDLAYALYRFGPLTEPANTDGFGTSELQAARARTFLDAYGCSREDRSKVVDSLHARLRFLVAFMEDAAAAGDENFARHIAEGHADLYIRDLDYLARNNAVWQKLIVD
jgi:Ser/Thr protein kinase RdoA (MazF antagonist)